MLVFLLSKARQNAFVFLPSKRVSKKYNSIPEGKEAEMTLENFHPAGKVINRVTGAGGVTGGTTGWLLELPVLLVQAAKESITTAE
jgi:hypothetical protein